MAFAARFFAKLHWKHVGDGFVDDAGGDASAGGCGIDVDSAALGDVVLGVFVVGDAVDKTRTAFGEVEEERVDERRVGGGGVEVDGVGVGGGVMGSTASGTRELVKLTRPRDARIVGLVGARLMRLASDEAGVSVEVEEDGEFLLLFGGVLESSSSEA